jgi:hypothetical protein
MGLEIKRAIMVPFTGEDWGIKLLIGILCYLAIPLVYVLTLKIPILALLIIFLSLTPMGFYLLSAHNELNNITPILPEWDLLKCWLIIGKSIILGFGYLILMLPVILTLVFSGIANKGLIIPIVIVGLIFFILIAPFTIFYSMMFLKDLKIVDAFRFPTIFKLYKAGFGGAYKIMFISFGITIALALILSIPILIIGFPYYKILADLAGETLNQKELIKVLSESGQSIIVFIGSLINYNLNAQFFKLIWAKVQENPQ